MNVILNGHVHESNQGDCELSQLCHSWIVFRLRKLDQFDFFPSMNHSTQNSLLHIDNVLTKKLDQLNFLLFMKHNSGNSLLLMDNVLAKKLDQLNFLPSMNNNA